MILPEKSQSALKANPNYLSPKSTSTPSCSLQYQPSTRKQEPREARSSLCKIWILIGEISQSLSLPIFKYRLKFLKTHAAQVKLSSIQSTQ